MAEAYVLELQVCCYGLQTQWVLENQQGVRRHVVCEHSWFVVEIGEIELQRVEHFSVPQGFQVTAELSFHFRMARCKVEALGSMFPVGAKRKALSSRRDDERLCGLDGALGCGVERAQ